VTPEGYTKLSARKDAHGTPRIRHAASISLKWYDRSVAPNTPHARTRSDILVTG
jgi:hypothetical protein